MHRVGEFEISRVVEMEEPFVDAATFFPDSTPDVIQANADWLMPRYIDPESGNLIFAFQSYVVRTARHTILVDTCIGPPSADVGDRAPSFRCALRSRRSRLPRPSGKNEPTWLVAAEK